MTVTNLLLFILIATMLITAILLFLSIRINFLKGQLHSNQTLRRDEFLMTRIKQGLTL